MQKKRSLLNAIPLSLIIGIIIGVIAYFGINHLDISEYQAKAKIITADINQANNENSNAEGYAATINSNKIKQRTLENLGIDFSLGVLDSKLEIKPVKNSPVIDIVVNDSNKLRAEDIADEYADLSVRVINNIYSADASVMEYAYESAGKVNNTLFYSIIAGAAGFLLTALFSMIGINRFNKKLLLRQVEIEEKKVNYGYAPIEDDSYEDLSDDEYEIEDNQNLAYKEDDIEIESDLDDKEDFDIKEDEFNINNNREIKYSLGEDSNNIDNDESTNIDFEDKIVENDVNNKDLSANYAPEIEEDEDFSETRIIDADEISKMSFESSINDNDNQEDLDPLEKYETLAKIPPYVEGDLDV